MLCALLSLSLIWGCKENRKGAEANLEEETFVPAVRVPKFSRDSAYTFVARQLDFGPRVLNSTGHDVCKNWLIQQFESYGAAVIQQDFTAKVYTGASLPATNIIAQYNPKQTKRIVLAAHWDSRHISDSPLNKGNKTQPVMGADDGASGVAVLLELARQLQATPIDFGVDLVLFDAEDYGDPNGSSPDSWGLGAQHWSKNLHYKDGIRPMYGILLDMVGGKGARFGKEYYSLQYAGAVVTKVWNLASSMGYSTYFVNEQTNPVTDDHYFVNTIARIPMIDIINQPPGSETGFPAHWHTDDDTLEAIDSFTLGAVGQLLLAVIYREYGGTLQ